MSYDALRRGRYSHFNQVYCVTTVTRGRQLIFTDLTTARLLARELRCLHDDGHVVSLAWVVMPDHLHWMIQLNECWSLSRVVKDPQSSFSTRHQPSSMSAGKSLATRFL